MTKSTAILNAVQSHVIGYANAKGISLADEFASVQEFKQFIMALTFKTATDIGLTVKEAFDLVAGDNAYDNLVSSVWESAQK